MYIIEYRLHCFDDDNECYCLSDSRHLEQPAECKNTRVENCFEKDT